MKDIGELKRLIGLSYGSSDLDFAMHSEEMDYAAQAIVEANKQRVGFKEYLQLHKEYLSSRGMDNDKLVSERLEGVKDITSYFISD